MALYFCFSMVRHWPGMPFFSLAVTIPYILLWLFLYFISFSVFSLEMSRAYVVIQVQLSL